MSALAVESLRIMKDAVHALVKRFQQEEDAYRIKNGGRHPQRQLRPASAEDIQRAEQAGFPRELLDFYRECEPADYIEFKQRIWSINKALEENRDYVPGCSLSPHGFIVFASNICGDAYCIDTNVATADGQHPVVLFPHDAIDEDASLSAIQPFRLEVATSLADFLVKFTNETLANEPTYG